MRPRHLEQTPNTSDTSSARDFARHTTQTVYFNESVAEARRVVDSVLVRWSSLLASLPEDERGRLQRSMGMKMEQLKVSWGLSGWVGGRTDCGGCCCGGGSLREVGRPKEAGQACCATPTDVPHAISSSSLVLALACHVTVMLLRRPAVPELVPIYNWRRITQCVLDLPPYRRNSKSSKTCT